MIGNFFDTVLDTRTRAERVIAVLLGASMIALGFFIALLNTESEVGDWERQLMRLEKA